VGAVLAGTVGHIDGAGLATLRVGDASLLVEADAQVGQRIQIQVLARDVIIATEAPRGLSVRNVVPARVVTLTPDSGLSVLLELDIGGSTTLLARITGRASAELELAAGKQVWALIKAVSLRGHVYQAPDPSRV
jgi:molybdate transport system ATP-binding protein